MILTSCDEVLRVIWEAECSHAASVRISYISYELTAFDPRVIESEGAVSGYSN